MSNLAVTGTHQTNLVFNLPAESEYRQIKEIAQMFFKSGLCPAGIKSPEAATIIALKGRELGMPLMVALSEISVVQGKPCISGQALLAFVRRDFPNAVIEFQESSNERCVILAKRSPDSQETKIVWDMAKAKKMGLDQKDNWKKQPDTMLKWRAVSEMKRFVFPEVLMGIYTPEEMEKVERDVSQEENSGQTDPDPIPEGSKPKNHAPQSQTEAAELQKQRTDEKMARAILAKEIYEIQQRASLSRGEMVQFVDGLFKKASDKLTMEEMQVLKLKLLELCEAEAEIA